MICGGGTGGHIYPALAVVVSLKQMGLQTEDFLWIGTQGEIEEKLVPLAGLQIETIRGGAIVGVSWRTRITNAAKLTASLRGVIGILDRFQPNVLFMTGGYVNGPVALAARLRRLPAAIFLPDIEPGLAIKRLSQFVERVACTAEASLGYFPDGKGIVTGYPIRQDLRDATRLSRQKALARFSLTGDRPTLFVFGGSRGARSINRSLMSILPELLNEMQIIHLSGNLEWPEVEANAKALPSELKENYRPYPYLHEDMGAAFRAANIVVARAGASMLGECPAFGLPSILIPYPYAWRYQKVNADYLVTNGAAIRLNDEKLPTELLPTVMGLLKNKDRLVEMSANAKKLDKPHAEEKLANLLVSLAQRTIT